jgi:Xaa-Pro aminopeptidase
VKRQAPHPDLATYIARRDRVLDELRRQNAAIVLYGGSEKQRSNDTHFRFRPDSNFHYLSGLAEPGAWLILRPDREAPFTLFVRERDAMAEIWAGRRPGPQGVKDAFAANEAFALSELEQRLPAAIEGCDVVYAPVGLYPRVGEQLQNAFARLRRQNRDGKICPKGMLEAGSLLDSQRLIKDEAALTSLRRAVEISAQGHIAAMRATKPGMLEYEIEARIEYEFRRQGSQGPGYGSIVAGGDNANILHYVDNECALVDGELLLVDAGAEWDLFTGDITRTWPVSAHFTPAQRDLYELVLAANEAGIAHAIVGNSTHKIHDVCVRTLAQGFIDLRLCKGTLDEVIDKELYKKYYMHKTSHWLGIDVHDVGNYCDRQGPVAFAPGMVLTVEPAVYVAANDADAPAEMRGVGIRIEDDVLVLAQGNEVLSRSVPKQVREVEALVGRE